MGRFDNLISTVVNNAAKHWYHRTGKINNSHNRHHLLLDFFVSPFSLSLPSTPGDLYCKSENMTALSNSLVLPMNKPNHLSSGIVTHSLALLLLLFQLNRCCFTFPFIDSLRQVYDYGLIFVGSPLLLFYFLNLSRFHALLEISKP